MDKLFVGMGEALWDLFPDGKRIGGAPANFAYHAGQLGFESLCISAVGDDPAGDGIVDAFRVKGLAHLLPRVDKPTGTVRVSLDAQGVPTYQIVEQVAWDHIPTLPETDAVAARTTVFCFGTLAQRNPVSRRAIHRFLDRMPKGEGRLRVFDINLRQSFYDPMTVEGSLAKCDLLKINDEELTVVCRLFRLPDNPVRAARAVMVRYGIRVVAITCGARCSRVVTATESSRIETPRVAVCDTVGAGDAFTAGLCAGLVAGASVGEAHRLAVDVSAHVCTCPGAMPELPEALCSRIANR